MILVVFLGAGCEPDEDRDSSTDTPTSLLTEVTAEAGFDATPPHWPAGTYRIPEISAGGVALLDVDGDGRLDIYRLVQPPPDPALLDSETPPRSPAPNRLWVQRTSGRFDEVPGAAGLADPGYSNAVAIGDANGDGHVDIFVANLEEDRLYLSDGAGKFVDATARSGIRGSAWSSSAAFVDFDRDGDLDLFVCHYLVDDPSRVCRIRSDAPRDYCGPSRYQGIRDTLWRNDGDASFTDATAEAAIDGASPGLGVVCVDLTGDGWVDIYVANDEKPNQLWVNQHNGRFVDEALARGVAVDGRGKTEASMGVAVGDTNGDGWTDIILTHLVDETHTLYRGESGGRFRDRSATAGVGGPTLKLTGWGCGLVDLDHDRDLDLVAVHGRVARSEPPPGAVSGEFWNDYAEPNRVFVNDSGRFEDAGERAASFSVRAESSRGLAFGDLDGDGDLDLVTTGIGTSLRVFRNDAPAQGTHWLRVRALTGKRDAIGARITLRLGAISITRHLISAYSFASANELVAHFGLGETTRVDSIDVLWPDGTSDTFGATETVDTTLTLRQDVTDP
jgi:hypothetical protein